MAKRTSFLALALSAFWLISLPAATEFMPVDEITVGMQGVGHTVFQDDTVEAFQAHILGVVRNVIGPKRDLILARLEGGPLERTGVIAGMSGSPVYIDGRLIGAVSYSLGQFSRDAIAGITPIAEMVEATSLDTPRRAAQQARLELPLTHEGVRAALQSTFAWVRPFADRPGDLQVLGGADLGSLTSQVGLLRPIATPLAMGGFRPEVAGLLSAALNGTGLMPVMAGAGTAAAAADEPDTLEPGDAVGISLLTGDYSLGATGTVTYVDETRVYAFGHPLYNLGPTEFPMTRAFVHTLIPSLSSSSKLASSGRTVGTIRQDRATAVAGFLGEGPALIPISVTLENERGLEKTISMNVVNDQMFTPLLTYLAIYDTLGSYERENGVASYEVTGNVAIKDHEDVAFADLFTGVQPSSGAAAYIAAPITFLLTNDDERVEIERVDVTISSAEEPRTARLERVWIDAGRARAGRTVPLKMLFRTYRGEEVVRTLSLPIPPNASGPLSLLVADGAGLTQYERRDAGQPRQPRDVPQVIRALNETRKNNRLYVRLLNSDPGAVVRGEALSSLPPSVLAVLQGDRSSGEFNPLRSATLGEWELPTTYAVSGSRLLTIDVDTH